VDVGTTNNPNPKVQWQFKDGSRRETKGQVLNNPILQHWIWYQRLQDCSTRVIGRFRP
jgi:hypothetical protein